MSYPFINGSTINEEDGGQKAAGLRPVRFGIPSLAFRATGLQPAQFGVPRAASGVDVVAHPESLAPARFGAHMALLGMPPSGVAFQAQSLKAGVLGIPAFSSTLQAGPVQSLQSLRFGALAARVALAAASLRTAQFGIPSSAVKAHAAPLRPSRFGAARAVHRLTATPSQSTRFGVPTLHLVGTTMPVSALMPVHFGVPCLGGMSLRARPLCAVRFGRPVLGRGASC